MKISKLLKGRPTHFRSDEEKMCYDILDELNIKYQRVVCDHYPKDDDEYALLDSVIGERPIKNLIFRTQNKAKFFYIIILKEDHFDKRAFRIKHDLTKIAMATDDDLKTYLGTRAHAVSIIELIKDKDRRFEVYIDKKVMALKYFRFHPFFNDTTIRIAMDDLLGKLMPYLKREARVI